MKTQRFIKIAIVLIIILIAGCGKKYKVETTIYADGTCLRTLIVSNKDSITEFYKDVHPIPIDTTWSLVIETDTNENGDTVFIHKASKLFESVEQLNKLYDEDTTMYSCTERTVKLKRKFRWFYTFLEYEETYPKLFDQPELTNYMDSIQYNYFLLTDDEQEEYLNEHFDSIAAKQFEDEVESRFLKWIEFTTILSCFDAVEKSAVNIENWPISESEFHHKSDSIIKLMGERDDLFENDDDVFDATKRVFGIDSALYLELMKEKTFKKFVDKYTFWEDVFINEDYLNSVIMPGLIIESNCTNIFENNEVEWKVGWIKYFTDDYTMFVQSRIINVWAFWVSGAFILFLVIILIKRLLKA